VSKVELGERRVTAAEIVALASILGVPVSTLMDLRELNPSSTETAPDL